MRKLLNVLAVWGAALAIAACRNSASEELKDGKAVAVPEVNEVEVVTLRGRILPTSCCLTEN